MPLITNIKKNVIYCFQSIADKLSIDGFKGFLLGKAILFYHGVDNKRFGEFAFLRHWDLLSRGSFNISITH